MDDKTDQLPLTPLDDQEKQLDYHLPPWQDSNFKQKTLILCMKALIYLPVALVLFLTITFYLTYLICYCYQLVFPPAETPNLFFFTNDAEKAFASTKGLCYALLMTLFTSSFIISYFQVVLTDPGTVPPEWELGIDDISNLSSKKKTDGRVRTCKVCEIRKPDRCHHCSQCDRCVLKLDHHCGWVVNCIGYRNHKFFILLLFYGTLALTVFVGSFWEMVVVTLRNCEEPEAFTLFVVSVYMFASFTGMLLFGFLGFHLWLVWGNTTTLEYCEKKRGKLGASEYSVTVLGNFKEVLGQNVFLWLVPFRLYQSEDSGLYFARRFN